MERQAALARGKPGAEDSISHLQALVLARAGRLDAARESARHAIELASAAGQRERAAVRETAVAVWEAWYGNAAAAKRNAMHVLEVANGRHVTLRRGIGPGDRRRAFASAGDRRRSRPPIPRGHVRPVQLRADTPRAVGAERERPVASHRAAATGRHIRVRPARHQLLRRWRRFLRRDVSHLRARRGLSRTPQTNRGGRGISKDSRSSRRRARGSDGRSCAAAARSRAHAGGGHDEGQGGLRRTSWRYGKTPIPISSCRNARRRNSRHSDKTIFLYYLCRKSLTVFTNRSGWSTNVM